MGRHDTTQRCGVLFSSLLGRLLLMALLVSTCTAHATPSLADLTASSSFLSASSFTVSRPIELDRLLRPPRAVGGAARCSEQFYRSECLSTSVHCSWCCDAPVGHQCFNRTELAPKTPEKGGADNSSVTSGRRRTFHCPPTSIVSEFTETCEALCLQAGSNCSQCERRSWCAFCTVNASVKQVEDLVGTCVSPSSHCPSQRETYQCSSMVVAPPSPGLVAAEHYLSLICLTTFLVVATVLLVIGLRWLGLLLRRVVPRRWEQLRGTLQRWWHRGEPEAEDLLSREGEGDTDAATDTEAVNDSGGREPSVASVAERDQRTAEEEASQTAQIPVPTGWEGRFEVCCLCLEHPAAVTYLPCHHTCCCESCSNRLRPVPRPGRVVACPLCRQPIQAMVSIRHVFPVENLVEA